MSITIFSAKAYDRRFFETANQPYGFTLTFLEAHLSEATVSLAHGSATVCVFTNDVVNKAVLKKLKEVHVQCVALRCAGFNNVDLNAAQELGIRVVRVPAYSPYAVAEHTVALMMTLNRQIHRSYNRVRDGNFSLEGLMGFDLHQKTVGLVGTGKIGSVVARILTGYGCRLLAYDQQQQDECLALGVQYVNLDELCRQSDVISLHCPLTPDTQHLINDERIQSMKPGVMLINTSRGGIIDTKAVIKGLKIGHIGYLGLDVYEEEADLFFEDLSGTVIQDDVFSRLLTFPNVLITGHQAFLTQEALTNIAETTLFNIHAVLNNQACPNELIPA